MKLLGLLIILASSYRFASAFQAPRPSRYDVAQYNKIQDTETVIAVAPSASFKRHRTTTSLSAAAVSAAVAIPSLQKIALSCLLPTCLGFVKVEYGVSYAYGGSVALMAYWILQQLQYGSLAYWHALALLFYGVRLNLFLLYRELNIPRFREFRERIEARQADKSRVTRTPFVLGCAFLYACLAAPLFVTSKAAVSAATTTPLLKACVITLWIGFVIAALGDLQKSFVKGVLGLDTLVKGGIFSRLRHPNYTGEIIGWSASFLASVVVALSEWDTAFIAPLVAGFLGWSGIVSVLAMAAAGLEKKQKEKYGEQPSYLEWVKRSWAGPTLSRKNT